MIGAADIISALGVFHNNRHVPPNTLETPSMHCTHVMYQSIPSLTIPSHILVALGVGFSLLCLARGSAPGVLNQGKSLIILKTTRDFRFVS